MGKLGPWWAKWDFGGQSGTLVVKVMNDRCSYKHCFRIKARELCPRADIS